MRYQWQLFCLALGFFSRVPMPKDLPYSELRLNQSSRYFSLVGLVLVLLLTPLCWALLQLFSAGLAMALWLLALVVLTGGFHEDGLADTADGLGGGFSLERKLEIMKDSRIGSYGTLALMLVLLATWQALTQLASVLPFITLTWVLLSVAALSRAVAASLMFVLPYQQLDASSKVKPLVVNAPRRNLWLLWLVAVTPLLLGWYLAFISSLALLVVVLLHLGGFLLIWRYYLKQLQGYSGDLLGAAQVLSALLGYLGFLAILGAR